MCPQGHTDKNYRDCLGGFCLGPSLIEIQMRSGFTRLRTSERN
jgi:hypothetical protein